jgi:hypothetical protein
MPAVPAAVTCAGCERARVQAAFLQVCDTAAVTGSVTPCAVLSLQAAASCHPRQHPWSHVLCSSAVRSAAVSAPGDVLPHTHPRIHPSLHMVRVVGCRTSRSILLYCVLA